MIFSARGYTATDTRLQTRYPIAETHLRIGRAALLSFAPFQSPESAAPLYFPFTSRIGLWHSKPTRGNRQRKEGEEGVKKVMNKGDLIAEMAQAAGISKAVAGKALDAFLEAIENALKNGDKVTLVGFGTFSTATRAARTGRNPRTREEISIPETRVPKFKPGSKFKEAVK